MHTPIGHRPVTSKPEPRLERYSAHSGEMTSGLFGCRSTVPRPQPPCTLTPHTSVLYFYPAESGYAPSFSFHVNIKLYMQAIGGAIDAGGRDTEERSRTKVDISGALEMGYGIWDMGYGIVPIHAAE